MKRKASFFSLKTQFENVGDTLINRELLRLAAKRSELNADFSRCPEFFKKNVSDGTNLIEEENSFLNLLISMFKCRFKGYECYYFLSPGGYFGDLTYSQLIKKYLITILLLIFKFCGVKICHVGVSYERLSKKNKTLIRLRSKLLWRHLVRDEKSKKYAIENGIKVDGVIPDLAFNLFIANKATQKKGDVVFSFRCDQYDKQYDDVYKLVEKYLLHNECASIVFYSQVKRDDEYMLKLHKAFSDFNVKYIPSTVNIDECEDYLKTARVVISNRLHVLLLSASLGANVIGCVSQKYNEKVKGIFAELGIESSLLNMAEKDYDFTPNNILISSLNKNKELGDIFGSIYER